MTDTNTTRETDDLAQTMAEIQHRHAQAAEHLASGRVDKADHQLFMTFMSLGDYVYGTENWETDVPGETDDD